MTNNGYDLELASSAFSNLADLNSSGRLYIANPGLVKRLNAGAVDEILVHNLPDPAAMKARLAGQAPYDTGRKRGDGVVMATNSEVTNQNSAAHHG